MTLTSRLLAADALRRIPSPCCRRIHVVDPSLAVPVRCCSRTFTPKRAIGGLVLVERGRA